MTDPATITGGPSEAAVERRLACDEAVARSIHHTLCGCAAAPDAWCDSLYMVAAMRAVVATREFGASA